MQKSVSIRSTLYEVEVDEGGRFIRAKEKTYPLGSGYGNSYSTTYVVSLKGRKWARTWVECSNNTWATRGHGMTDFWVEEGDFIPRDQANLLWAETKRSLEEAEDDSPEIKEIFSRVKAAVAPDE